MKRRKSLVQEIKEQCDHLLNQRYPDFNGFSIKTSRWRASGDIEIRWMDGPAQKKVAALLSPLKEGHRVHISIERRYTDVFLRRVATEYCAAKGCDVPAFEYLGDGSAWFDWRVDRDLAKTIVHECQKLDEEELSTLAYRLHPINNVMTPVRSWIVRRRDYSHGKYPSLAVCREKSFGSYARKLFQVRRRINQYWVQVVEGTASRYICVSELDEHVRFCKEYGREY